MTEGVVQILLVDDQPANLEALEATLEPTGCRFVLARSADEALLALLDQEFAAIVLDLKMPGITGLELAKLIKSRRRTRDVPILFLTAHMVEEKDITKGYGVGAVDRHGRPGRAAGGTRGGPGHHPGAGHRGRQRGRGAAPRLRPVRAGGALACALAGRAGTGGWGQPGHRTAAADAGFNQHLRKPVDPGRLLELLASVAAA